MEYFIRKFKISTELTNKIHKELLAKNMTKKLSNKEKQILNFYKGPPKMMNKDGFHSYADITNYLYNFDIFNEIHIDDFNKLCLLFQVDHKGYIKFDDIPKNIHDNLVVIQKKRIKSIVKYIKTLDQVISKGQLIDKKLAIYRFMSRPIDGNIIKNVSSWSLIPQPWFCDMDKECHLYVTTIPKNLKTIYIDYEGNDKNMKTFTEFDYAEYEFLLPRNLEFKETSTNKMEIPNREFNRKELMDKKTQTLIIHNIKLIKKHKSDVEIKNSSQIKLIFK